jgi:uncharacterized protein with PIN domain
MKMYVFDASALFAYLQKTAGASKVNERLKDAIRDPARVLMSAVNYGEVYGRILRDYGLDQAHTSMNALGPLPIEVLEAAIDVIADDVGRRRSCPAQVHDMVGRGLDDGLVRHLGDNVQRRHDFSHGLAEARDPKGFLGLAHLFEQGKTLGLKFGDGDFLIDPLNYGGIPWSNIMVSRTSSRRKPK